MKNKLSKILLVRGLLFGLVAIAPVVRAQSFQSESFLTGSNLQVNVGSTVSYGVTNIYLKNGGSYGPAYTTNAPTANTTNAQAIVDVSSWANRDGTAPLANITVRVSGPAGATNTLTFNFATVPSGGSTAATSATGLFQFSFQKRDAIDDVVVTNVPTAWLQGCGKVRLNSIVPTGVSGSTNYTVVSVRLNGFTP